VNINWQWAAAVYTTFSTDHSTLVVKATDDNHHDCVTLNSDHAGTAENTQYRSSGIGGARGGGSSNFTGSLSGTEGVAPCDTF
jgi:hypothetical protein